MKMEIKKIDATLPLKVRAQGCFDDCEERMWVGKSAGESGCYYATVYSAKWSPMF